MFEDIDFVCKFSKDYTQRNLCVKVKAPATLVCYGKLEDRVKCPHWR